jgi:mRNA interferase MazF
MSPFPSRGEVWRGDLDPVRGHEQGRVRPVLVVSSDHLNHGGLRLVTVVPLTTKGRPINSWLRIDPPEGGLSQISFVICDQIRTISKERLSKRFGTMSPSIMAEVERRLKWLLELR